MPKSRLRKNRKPIKFVQLIEEPQYIVTNLKDYVRTGNRILLNPRYGEVTKVTHFRKSK